MSRWQSMVVSKARDCWHLVLIPVTVSEAIGEPAAEGPPVVVKSRARSLPVCQQAITGDEPLASYIAKRGGINPDYNRGSQQETDR